MDTASIIILSIFGVFALIGFFKGLSQGFSRQIIRTLTVAASAVGSVFIARAFYGKISGFFEGKTIEEIHAWVCGLKFFPKGLDISWMLNLNVETVRAIIIIPATLICIPLIFVAFFLTISGLMKIVHVILCGLFGLSKKRKNVLTSLLGAVLGLAEGIAIAALIVMPVTGIAKAAETAVTEVNEQMPESAEAAQLTSLYTSYLKPINDNAIVSTVGKLGVNALYSGLVTVETNGKSTDMTTLLPDAALIYANKSGFQPFHWQTLTDQNKLALINISNILESNPYFSEIAAGLISGIARSAESGAIPIPLEPPFDAVFHDIVHVFETTDSTNIHTDIDTILAVYFILSDEGVLATFGTDSNAMLTALTTADSEGITPVTKVIDEIKKNERTKPLISVITKISLSVMKEQIGLPEDADQIYESVKGGLNETLKIDRESFAEGEAGDAEYKAAVSTSIDETLKANDIVLEPEIVDTMADYVTENFADKEEITDDEINDIILSYYDAYLEYQKTGKIPEGTLPEGTIPEGTIPEGTEPEGTEPEGTEPEGTESEGTESEGSESEGSESEN